MVSQRTYEADASVAARLRPEEVAPAYAALSRDPTEYVAIVDFSCTSCRKLIAAFMNRGVGFALRLVPPGDTYTQASARLFYRARDEPDGILASVGVAVVGSANMDLVIRASRLPVPGETVLGGEFRSYAGGKGANQAAAAARLGGAAALVGKIGKDAFGDALAARLREVGVATDWLRRDSELPTGVALIVVDDAGGNSIVVAPGANAALSAEEVRAGLDAIAAQVVLAQFEAPLEAVAACAGAECFVLNPAPARPLPPDLAPHVDILTPNEVEAERLTGVRPNDDESCLAAARPLLEAGVGAVVFTLGARGSYLATSAGGRHFPSIDVRAVDTTAAGDAFNGALAHFLDQGREIDNAIALANRVGALCATAAGAMNSLPDLDALRSVAGELL